MMIKKLHKIEQEKTQKTRAIQTEHNGTVENDNA